MILARNILNTEIVMATTESSVTGAKAPGTINGKSGANVAVKADMKTGTTTDANAGVERAWASSNTRGAELALHLVRVALGTIFIAHALLKLVGYGLPATAEFFVSVGYPGWSAYPVFAIELIGGIALVAGVRVRVAAVALIPVMLGALLVHAPNGWRFDASGGGWEYVAFLIVALIAQAVAGTPRTVSGQADQR